MLGGDGYDVLYGSDNNDKLYGYDGSDELYGGNGSDVLYGGNGNNLADGGLGADTFNFSSNWIGTTTLADFGEGADQISGVRFDDIDTNSDGVLNGSDADVSIWAQQTFISFTLGELVVAETGLTAADFVS